MPNQLTTTSTRNIKSSASLKKKRAAEGSLTNSLAMLYRNKLSSPLSIISDTLFEVSKVFRK